MDPREQTRESVTEPIYKPFEPPTVGQVVSINWKVLALIILTVITSTICILIYLRFVLQDTYGDSIVDHLRNYAHLITTRLQTTSDPAVIDSLIRPMPIDMRIESHNRLIHSTDPSLPPYDSIRARTTTRILRPYQDFLFREINGRAYGLLSKGERRYVIAYEYRRPPDHVVPATALVIALLASLILGAWWLTRRLLRPIDELMEGVKKVGSGDFRYRVPVRTTDELGTLVSAFNAMSEQIAEIVASKRRLLFDVSHELRSPLTRMNIIIAMLPDGKPKEKLQKNANELNTMITELLENERLAVLGATLVVERFDLVDLACKVVESFADEEERIEFDTLTEELEVDADYQRLTVALRNVISNALKYSDADKKVRVSVFPDDDGARIIIRDEGIGIPEDAVEKIFEPFYRTDESRTRTTGGYGLGLALTKAIIEAHGGTIKAESKEHEGTRLMIWIPVHQDSIPIEQVPVVQRDLEHS